MNIQVSRCICKPGSDWDEDPINIIPQMDSPSNKDQNYKHPLPSDWSDQENFWNGEEYEKIRSHKARHRWMLPPKRDSDSDRNDNLYPQNYRAKVQSQVSPRQPPPGWPKGVRKETPPCPKINPNILPKGNPALNENENPKEAEVYPEPTGKGSSGLVISGVKTIPQKAFDDID